MSRTTTHRGESLPVLDQASNLRELVRLRSLEVDPSTPLISNRSARSIVVTSGKGGVGGSNFALNLAIALGEMGQRVVVVDADLGLANLDILCGLAPSADLGDVLTGACSLSEALIEGPSGIKLIAGAHGVRGIPDVLGDGPSKLGAELAELESEADFVVIDAGSGLNSGIATIAESADEVVVVTTPEPTSIADAQASLGRLRRLAGVRCRLVVNQARSSVEGNETLKRLTWSAFEVFNTKVEPLGSIRFDSKVSQAVRERRPFVLASPKGVASRDVRAIALTLFDEAKARDDRPREASPGFFGSLFARWATRRSAL